MHTVVETQPFARRADDLLTEDERTEIARTISDNPKAGAVMRGTGGVRKLRIALQGRGKRGGARVIYYYYNETVPVFLLAMFAKNEKDNLTKAERNTLKGLAGTLIDAYQDRKP